MLSNADMVNSGLLSLAHHMRRVLSPTLDAQARAHAGLGSAFSRTAQRGVNSAFKVILLMPGHLYSIFNKFNKFY